MESNLRKDTKGSEVFNDSTFTYVYRKSEKIVAAVYLVTGLFPEGEPLRSSLRTSALSLIKDIIDNDQTALSDRANASRRIAVSVTKVISLLDIALVAKLVSAMNHSILKRELSGLVGLLEERLGSDDRGVLFDPSYFAVAALGAPTAFPQRKLTDADSASIGFERRSISSVSSHRDRVASQTKAPARPAASMSYTAPETDTESRTPVTGERTRNSAVKDSKSDRRETILAIIKDRKVVGIKDVAAVITDCGEKTIQRELLAMVADGLLRKEGERRWSTYMVA